MYKKEGLVNSDNKIGFGEYAAFGIGGIGVRMMFSIIGAYFLMYMTNVAYLDVAVVSVIIAVSKLLDGISDLVIGDVIDNTKSKYGKARVWLMRLCLPFALSMMLLFWIPPHFPTAVKYIYVFLMYNITNTFIFTFLQISHFSLVSLMSSDRTEQGILGTLVSLSTMISAFIGNAFFVKLLMVFTDEAGNQNTQRAYTLTVLAYSVAMIVMTLLMALTVKERVTDTADKPSKQKSGFRDGIRVFKMIITDKYWVSIITIRFLIMTAAQLFITVASYFALYVLHDMSAMSMLVAANILPSIIIMLFLPFFMDKLNKRKMFILGIVISIVGTAALGLFGNSKNSVVAILLFLNVGSGFFSGVVYGIVADVVRYTKYTTGKLIAGAGNACVSAAVKLGQGAATILLGFGLSFAGFNAALDKQPESVVPVIKAMYSWAPCACFTLILIIFLVFFDLEKKHPEALGKKEAE